MKRNYLFLGILILLLSGSIFACSSSSDSGGGGGSLLGSKSDPTLEAFLDAVIAGQDYSQYVDTHAENLAKALFSRDTLQSYTIKEVIDLLGIKTIIVKMVFEEQGTIDMTFTVQAGKITGII